MRFISLIVLLLLVQNLFALQTKQGPIPDWVKPIAALDLEIGDDEQGYRYLLLDFQDNLLTQESYRHYVIKVSSPKGLTEISDISAVFDPSYQKLTFHEINIRRGSEVLRKLKTSEIKELQRETSMERSLYDGSLTALINLTDVREGDILEYSYTVKGFNPINEGHYNNIFYQKYTIPVNRIYTRILEHPEMPLTFKYFREAQEFQNEQYQQQKSYFWDLPAKEVVQYDNNTPPWFEALPHAEISSFQSWEAVSNWAAPLYKYDEPSVKRIMDDIKPISSSQKGRVQELIRVVQDDIRYLGLESGIGAYKPHSPSEVYDQKYGDCKDKSLLLVALLRNQGLEAYPMLVNTSATNSLIETLPRQGAFNHCVVKYELEGHDYFVDPTISNQGGDPDHVEFPNYKYGLLVKAGETSLITIEKNTHPSIDILEKFEIKEIGQPVSLTVKTTYTGSRADIIRSEFNSASDETIESGYLNFYSSLFPGIGTAQPIEFEDFSRATENEVVVREYYSIDGFWQYSEDSTLLQAEVGPLVLANMLNFPKSAKRTQPYYLGESYKFNQVTELTLPEEWNVEEATTSIYGPGFSYYSSVFSSGKNISITYTYDLLREQLQPEEVAEFLSKTDQVSDNLSFFLSNANEHVAAGDYPFSWVSIIITIIALTGGIFFGIQTYKNFDPEPWEFAENTPIGGWLILPAIGLSFTPFRLIVEMIDTGLYNPLIWSNITHSELENKSELVLYLGTAITYNTVFLMFSIFVIILFFQRRTSVPRIITIYYAIGIFGPLLDLLAANLIVPDSVDENEQLTSLAGIGRTILAAAIWIPYFNISERSKSTFCRKFGQKRGSISRYSSSYSSE